MPLSILLRSIFILVMTALLISCASIDDSTLDYDDLNIDIERSQGTLRNVSGYYLSYHEEISKDPTIDINPELFYITQIENKITGKFTFGHHDEVIEGVITDYDLINYDYIVNSDISKGSFTIDKNGDLEGNYPKEFDSRGIWRLEKISKSDYLSRKKLQEKLQNLPAELAINWIGIALLAEIIINVPELGLPLLCIGVIAH